jgi:hypothetical protein
MVHASGLIESVGHRPTTMELKLRNLLVGHLSNTTGPGLPTLLHLTNPYSGLFQIVVHLLTLVINAYFFRAESLPLFL